jgi:hypothetical protein
MDDIDKVKTSGRWQLGKPVSEPPIKAFEVISNTMQKVMREHEQRHHVEREAPVAAPSAPAAAPFKEPRERPARAPVAPASGSPTWSHHRADAVGHTAAAVPQHDQCAADDLELAGHRHPRATDPWFAEHGSA